MKKFLKSTKYVLFYIYGFLVTVLYGSVLGTGAGFIVAAVISVANSSQSLGEVFYLVYIFGFIGGGLSVLIWLLVAAEEFQELKRSEQTFSIWAESKYGKGRAATEHEYGFNSGDDLKTSFIKTFNALKSREITIRMTGLFFRGVFAGTIIGAAVCWSIAALFKTDIESQDLFAWILIGGVVGGTFTFRRLKVYKKRLKEFEDLLIRVTRWIKEIKDLKKKHLGDLRWISQEIRDKAWSTAPSSTEIEHLLKKPPREEKILNQQLQTLQSIARMSDPASTFSSTRQLKAFIQKNKLNTAPEFRKAFEEFLDNVNNQILTTELDERKNFLDTIEKSPLTEEQATSVICYDNHVQVVAAAGSGKTSVMVARAAYAIDKGFVKPNEVLLLAFNRNAKEELQTRIDARLPLSGISSKGIRVNTFHALGLNIIAKGTGKKPLLAPWVERGQTDQQISEIITGLFEDEQYKIDFEKFRLFWGRPPSDGPDEAQHDAWEKKKGGQARGQQGFETADGKMVKSEGERKIADFLFYNGVRYEYEKPYFVDTADSDHAQYRPDFYYPEIDSWHEHWGLDKNGEPPPTPEWSSYLEGKKWKEELHREHSVNPLIETTWHQIVICGGFDELEEELSGRGLNLEFDSKREPVNEPPVTHQDMARLMRTFMTHIKSNSLTKENFESRTDLDQRTQDFMELYWPVHDEWNKRLKQNNYIDFEDMLVQAAEILETTNYDLGYKLVLVDEFQDSSNARARLVSGLLKKSNRYLLAVGDDWQSINRFAGSDISVMTNFENRFAKHLEFQLTKTFRCPQDISDVASKFIMENPNQIRKDVTSDRGAKSGGSIKVALAEVNAEEAIQEVIEEELLRIGKEEKEKFYGGEARERPSVFILGRYTFDNKMMPREIPENLDVQFKTIHRSKGLEADYIIVPNLRKGKYGLPSEMIDDPVLEAAMPEREDFQNAEERRLFYVAMTRAREELILIAPGYETISPFLVELCDQLQQSHEIGELSDLKPCPSCKKGVLVKREGEYGAFYGCSTFPACIETSSIYDN